MNISLFTCEYIISIAFWYITVLSKPRTKKMTQDLVSPYMCKAILIMRAIVRDSLVMYFNLTMTFQDHDEVSTIFK